MRPSSYEFQSDFAKRYLKLGREEGREEGVRRGRAEAVLRVLSARSLEPSDPQRATVLSCDDLATLDRWLERALTASSPDDLFH